jgi:fido (protein-threonine AMPylation protein)
MFDFVGGRRELSTGYIRELHAALLRNQDTYTVVDPLGRAFEKDLERGAYKTTPNSPTTPDGSIHEYCPPEHVASEMDRLVALHAEHERRGVPVEVEAAWLHHRFAQIHPFADGNGRVARSIASLVFIKAGWFPLIVKRDDWPRYVEMLERADRGDLRPLTAQFVEAQRNSVVQAGEIALELRPADSPAEAIAAIRDKLLERGALSSDDWQPARHTAEELVASALHRFQEIAADLTQAVGTQTGLRFAATGGAGLPNRLLQKIAAAACHLADARGYNVTTQLVFRAPDEQIDLRLSFYAIGPRFHGLIAVVPSLDTQGEPHLLSTGIFQINYEESRESAETRFRPWLERVIVEGLNRWRRAL